MADNEQLDSFLTGAPQDAPETPEPARVESTPEHAPDPSRASPEAPAAAQKETPEPEDEALVHVQGGDNRTVPFSALEKVRNDWKSKAAAEKARADLLAQQLEDAKRPAPQMQAPAPPPVMQFQQPPDFHQDPNGWAATMVANQQRALLNERLNHSEALVSERIGSDDLAKYVNEFKQAAGKDQTLWGKLYSQPSPYAWMVKEMERQRSMADVGDDPAAFRARVVAEERAKWEAELQQRQPVQPQPSPYGRNARPLPPQQPSLAGARSVAARAESTFSGPPSLDDIFPSTRGVSRH
ncbi:MAG TPA: hypothetical protein VGI78_02285 [Acetobacteraceae bacterium]|jgi:hypothetical protein